MEAIKELEKIAVKMPNICIMDTAILSNIPSSIARDLGGDSIEYSEVVQGYFTQRTGVQIPFERCHNIISNSGESLGEFDFYFEWFEEPAIKQLNNLIKIIDESLTPLGCLYTITTRK